jgi:hypothetical protein
MNTVEPSESSSVFTPLGWGVGDVVIVGVAVGLGVNVFVGVGVSVAKRLVRSAALEQARTVNRHRTITVPLKKRLKYLCFMMSSTMKYLCMYSI